MIFIPIDITQASKGAQRAETDAFDNLNKLIAADAAAQQNYESFAGAPGRVAAAGFESDRQVQLANTLQPQLGSIVNSDAQAILGAAAARGVAGQTQSALANFTIPNIPTLGANAAATNLAVSNNRLVETSVLTPQQQAIESTRQAFSLTQEPILQSTQAQQNQLANQLQSGEAQYQRSLQAYTQAKLNGQAANLPFEQALTQERTRLDRLKTQVGAGNALTDISTQPARQYLAQSQAAGQVAREPAVQSRLNAEAAAGSNEAQYILAQQGTMQGIRTAQQQILGNNVSWEAATQPQKLAIAELELQYSKVKKQYDVANQKYDQQIQTTNTQIKQGQAYATLARLPTMTKVAEIKDLLALGEVQFEQLNQPQKQAIQQDNITVERSNTALALTLLPQQQKIRTIQSGMALTDAQQLQQNQGYVNTASQITARSAPDEARARAASAKWTANVAAGLRVIQGLGIYDAGTLSPTALANASASLRNNGLMGEGQNLISTPAGVVIRNRDGSPDVPISQLKQGLQQTQQKASGISYKYQQFVTPDGQSVPTTTITSDVPLTTEQVNARTIGSTNSGQQDFGAALGAAIGDLSGVAAQVAARQAELRN